MNVFGIGSWPGDLSSCRVLDRCVCVTVWIVVNGNRVSCEGLHGIYVPYRCMFTQGRQERYGMKCISLVGDE
jgi:hypothetical protein